MMKRCNTCNEIKPLDEFYRQEQMSDGHLNQCKTCVTARVRLHRRMNDSVREYDRVRSKTPKRKALAAKRQRMYREKNEAAYKAQNALNNALRDGKIAKEPCAICGASERVHAHHKDYSDPLDVTWLCAKCHARIHAQGLAYVPNQQSANQ